jgi:serine/threonine protein kinase
MINENPGFRPDIGSVKKHPLFWKAEKRFGFLRKAYNLINRNKQYITKLKNLCGECGNKFAAFDKKFLTFMERKTRYKRYRYDELLRFIRNAYEHYKDLPSEWQFGSLDKLWESYIEPKSLNILLRTYYIMYDFRKNPEMKKYYDQKSKIPVLAHWATKSKKPKIKRKPLKQKKSPAQTSNSNNSSKRFKMDKQQTATVTSREKQKLRVGAKPEIRVEVKPETRVGALKYSTSKIFSQLYGKIKSTTGAKAETRAGEKAEACSQKDVQIVKLDPKIDFIVKRRIASTLFDTKGEIEFLKQYNHLNIIQILGFELCGKHEIIKIEKVCCSLSEYVRDPKKYNRPISYSDKKNILSQIVCGLSFLHEMSIPHQNIKPNNILLKFNEGEITAILSDMIFLKSNISEKNKNHENPTLWDSHEYGEKNQSSNEAKGEDIFYLGCIFYFMLTDGKDLFKVTIEDDGKTKKLALENNFKLKIKPLEYTLIRAMIDRILQKRPSVEAIMKFPFFWNKQRCIEFLVDVADSIEKDVTLSSLLNKLAPSIFKSDNTEIPGIMNGNHQHTEYLKQESVVEILQLLRGKKTVHSAQEVKNQKIKFLKRDNEQEIFFTSLDEKFPKFLIFIYITVQGKIYNKISASYYDQNYKFSSTNLT